MTLNDLPTIVVALTVSSYWLYVGWMILRVRQEAKRIRAVLIPAQRREQYMWIIWVPVIGAWIEVPYLAVWPPLRQNAWIGVPEAVLEIPSLLPIRLLGAAFAVTCLLLSIKCWRHMGSQWRMGVDPTQKARLLTDGPFAVVRHPIYALSMTMMLCTVVVLPSPVMLIVAAIHLSLMHMKARNEERFLQQRYQMEYDEYCRHTGRFFPSFGWGWRLYHRRNK
jgi:protein-S-isoprenylcysteine O-methyltransferase Ste14